jgi:hypothetical protein
MRERGWERNGGVLVTETGLFITAHAAHLMEMIRPISKLRQKVWMSIYEPGTV